MKEAIIKMNELGAKKIPFLFVIDYKFEKPIVIKLKETVQHNIFYKINSFTNFPETTPPKRQIVIQKKPIAFNDYKTAFDQVQMHIKRGDSFLVNLTKPTLIKTGLTLQEIFEYSNAKYKLYFNNEFVSFSPEIFIKISKQHYFVASNERYNFGSNTKCRKNNIRKQKRTSRTYHNRRPDTK